MNTPKLILLMAQKMACASHERSCRLNCVCSVKKLANNLFGLFLSRFRTRVDLLQGRAAAREFGLNGFEVAVQTRFRFLIQAFRKSVMAFVIVDTEERPRRTRLKSALEHLRSDSANGTGWHKVRDEARVSVEPPRLGCL